MITTLALLSCNTAPLDYNSDTTIGNGSYTWSHPTNEACEDAEDAERLGEFDWCRRGGQHTTPVDDPIYEDCANVPVTSPEPLVFAVFDGLLARAYAVSGMPQHDLVHDTWNGVDVLVDW